MIGSDLGTMTTIITSPCFTSPTRQQCVPHSHASSKLHTNPSIILSKPPVNSRPTRLMQQNSQRQQHCFRSACGTTRTSTIHAAGNKANVSDSSRARRLLLPRKESSFFGKQVRLRRRTDLFRDREGGGILSRVRVGWSWRLREVSLFFSFCLFYSG
jgi:hypothetical protein